MTPLPPGWRLTVDETVRRARDGRVLVGGIPTRVVRLSARGARWFDHVLAGAALSGDTVEARLARRLVDAGIVHPRPAAGRLTPRDVSLVVPVRDDATGLAHLLATAGEVGEVVVVDDGSACPVSVGQLRTPSLLVRRTVAGGPGAARDAGWRRARHPIVAFVDADVTLPGGAWLPPLLAHFDDPAVAAVAPRVIARRGTAPRWLAEHESLHSPLDMGNRPATVRPGGAVPYVPTAALVVRRAAIESLHGFDTTLRTGEDVDLVWRLAAAGWTVRYDPGVRVLHRSRGDVRSWVTQRIAYGASAAALARRHGATLAPLRLPPAFASACVAFVAGRPTAGSAVALAGVAVTARRLHAAGCPPTLLGRAVLDVHRRSIRRVGEAARRPLWPAAVVLGAVVPRCGRALLAGALAPVVVDAARDAARNEATMLGARGAVRGRWSLVARLVAARLLDDVAYGTGVWIGCVAHRSIRPLVPSVARGDIGTTAAAGERPWASAATPG